MDSKYLSELWEEFELQWSNYLRIYQMKLQALTELHFLLDSNCTSESLAALRTLLDQYDQAQDEKYEFNLRPYLLLAEQLNSKDKFPLINRRLDAYYENTNLLSSLHSPLEDKIKTFFNS